MRIKLEEQINEIRRLMDYNRSSVILINEQGFGGAAGIVGTPQNFKTDSGIKDPKSGIFYRQKFKKELGYFDSEMMLGECFTISYFDSNSNAKNCMDFPNIYKDPNPKLGYYIYGDVLNDDDNKSEKVRIYLPKDTFFTDLNGIVKSFIAYPTCPEQQKKQGGIKYTLIYQLNNPQKAIIDQVMTEDGVKFVDDDASRGWSISFFEGSQSGYFAIGLNDDEGFDNVSKSKPATDLIPTQFKEFSLENYGEEFGRSEFDIWYDSGWGIAIQIGGAILVGIISGGIGTLLTAGMESLLAARAIVLGAELAGELIYAIPEAIYLKNRGMNTASTIVLLFSLLPLFNRLGLVKRLAGDMSKEQMNQFVLNLAKKADAGDFRSPADVKKWLSSLDANTRAWAERMIKEGAAALEKISEKELKDQLQNGLKKLINETRVKNASKVTAKKIYDEEFVTLIKNINPTTISGLKLAGIDVLATFGSMPVVMMVVKDNEEFIRDPQRILDKASENIQKIASAFEEKRLTNIKTEIEKLKQAVTLNPDDMDSARKLVDLVYELGTLNDKTSTNDVKSEILKSFLQELLVDIKIDYFEAQWNKNLQNEAVDLNKKLSVLPSYLQDEFWTTTTIAHCQSLPYTDFKSINDACDFIDWVNKTHSNDFTYETISKRIKRGLIDTCEIRKGLQPDWSIMKYDCEIRTAYNMYKNEYEKLKNVPGTQKKQ
jgi:hypothetical protein